MHTLDIVPGVHRLARGSTACYLVETDDQILLVDAGLPAFWSDLAEALKALGRTPDDVRHVLLTHGHFDHVGIARRLEKSGAQVWVHRGDQRIAEHPYRYEPGRPRLTYPIRHPRSLPHLASLVGAGALWVQGVDAPRVYDDPMPFGDVLTVVPTPGHTDGHVAIVLPDHDAVITGDALVTLDPYTGRTGPCIVAQAGTHDAEQALQSLDAIGASGMRTVLPGHGEVWRDGAEAAAWKARLRPVP
ncbi:MBL fold metallo-hydrolase [Mumia sp. zg.B21]|uniref:MBL fold metallo-hydrolase n=1 Tax=unclassified Mumia TaxID=2621872 RepID=UPI001C6E7600|nr:MULTISPECIES: MBL fold metallo-hydrolase [unclassified Mumia]MBW9208877.1 MBL fold metallo-hydrolase [Mumia sp. zg.B21]MDD9349850.1 MBL fold metallo-hydrolase [Mumia sp.]